MTGMFSPYGLFPTPLSGARDMGRVDISSWGPHRRRWVAGPSFPTMATCTGTTLPVCKLGFLAVLLPSYTKGKLLNHSASVSCPGVFAGIVMRAC